MFNIDQIIRALQTDKGAQNNAISGAAGLAAGMLLSGGLGKLGGKAAKMGTLAAVGGLAYKAWQAHQSNQQHNTPAPREDAFVPTSEHEQEELGKSLVRAMIAAAKADGRIDAEERDAIFRKLEGMSLSSEEKAWVFDELASPLDINAVVQRAKTTEHAAEIYAASLVAITADTAAEQAYLDALASRLRLEPGLVNEIHVAAGEKAPQRQTAPISPFAYTPSASNI